MVGNVRNGLAAAGRLGSGCCLDTGYIEIRSADLLVGRLDSILIEGKADCLSG